MTIKTPAELREEARREAFQNHATRLTAETLLVPVVAFILMLFLGALHGVFLAVPAVGYGTAVLFVLGVDAVAFLSRKFRRK